MYLDISPQSALAYISTEMYHFQHITSFTLKKTSATKILHIFAENNGLRNKQMQDSKS